MRFCILHRNSRWSAKIAKSHFWEKLVVDSVDSLGVKKFTEIPLCRIVSEINVFVRFTAGKRYFGESLQMTLQISGGSISHRF